MRSFASGRAAGEDELAAVAQELVELVLAQGLELISGDDRRAVPGDAHSAGDLRCRQPVVAGDDDDPDPRPVAVRNRLGDLRSRGVEERDQAEQAELALRVVAAIGSLPAARQSPPRDGEHPKPLRGPAFEHGQDFVPVGLFQRLVVLGTSDEGRALEHLLGRTLRVHGDPSVLTLVDGRHEAELRVEAIELPTIVLAPGDVDVDPERVCGLEQSDLGRLAARLSRPLRIELGRAARRDRPAEEREHRDSQRRPTRRPRPLRGRARRAASRCGPLSCGSRSACRSCPCR